MTAAQVPYLVHVSSSVVNSQAVDFYTESKKAQEKLVVEAGIPHATLRPTLMFGWFDRKHLGWLARFMKRVPVFPIPGRSEEHTSELQSLMRNSYAVFCLKKKNKRYHQDNRTTELRDTHKNTL